MILENKILTITAYDKRIFHFYSRYIKLLLKDSKHTPHFFTKIVNIKKITLLKSPHVYKKAKEHYFQKKYSMIIKITITEKELTHLLSLLHINRNFISLEIS